MSTPEDMQIYMNDKCLSIYNIYWILPFLVLLRHLEVLMSLSSAMLPPSAPLSFSLERMTPNLGEFLVNFSLHDFKRQGQKALVGHSIMCLSVLEKIPPSDVQYFTWVCFSSASKCD